MSQGTQFSSVSPSTSESARCSTDEMRQTASQLKQNVQDLGNQARTAAREQVQSLKETAGTYMEQGREQLDSLRQSAGEYMEQGRQRAIEMERSLESQIRAQPLRAVLIAAGVGLVAGILVCRR